MDQNMHFESQKLKKNSGDCPLPMGMGYITVPIPTPTQPPYSRQLACLHCEQQVHRSVNTAVITSEQTLTMERIKSVTTATGKGGKGTEGERDRGQKGEGGEGKALQIFHQHDAPHDDDDDDDDDYDYYNYYNYYYYNYVDDVDGEDDGGWRVVGLTAFTRQNFVPTDTWKRLLAQQTYNQCSCIVIDRN